MFASVAAVAADGAPSSPAIRTAAELAAALKAERIGARFNIEATVIFPCNPICCTFAVQDGTGAVTLREDAFFPDCPMKAGDRVRIKGNTFRYKHSGVVAASDNTAEILSHGPPPEPIDTSIPELLAGQHITKLVRFTGSIRDAFVDEIDPLWGYLVLQDGPNALYATFAAPTQDVSALTALVGAKVRLSGLYAPYIVGSRQIGGLQLLITGLDAVEVISPAPKDLFDVPPLTSVRKSHPFIFSGPKRRKASGRVIAVWHGDRLLLRTTDGRIARVDLSERNPPKYGDSVDVSGNLETDLYRYNLSRAVWRRHTTGSFPAEPDPLPVTAAALFTDDRGRAAVQVRHHGQPIRIKGVVRSLPSPNHPHDRLGLECDKRIVPIDASAYPTAFDGLEIGCEIEISGICLVETENWRPYAPLPHVEGIAVIVRTPADVRILSHPPWWTPGRLLTVIGVLLAALTGTVVWNRSLNRLAERRGRELTEETVARVTSELKVGERTRLAIELHDALSQNLTGASLEVAAAASFAKRDADCSLRHLDIAAKTLRSCRAELRNCIWDLRSYALEEENMDEALRRTIAPHLEGAELAVRFNVPRKRLSDNTAHALLRIIRELVQNAVRHGHAKTVKVAGTLNGEELLFSVTDDGQGFNPESSPGVRQGHFGLQGIQERITQYGGTLKIESAPGKGAHVMMALRLSPTGRPDPVNHSSGTPPTSTPQPSIPQT